jgi:copper chaperone CopZ
MKTTILILLSFFFFAQTSSVIASNATVKTVTFKCPEINCSGCKAHITEAVKTLEGIKSVKVNLDTKIVTVKFDDSKTSSDKIKAVIEDAGYSAEAVD